MSEQLIDVVDVTEVFDVVTDECRYRPLVNAETAVNIQTQDTAAVAVVVVVVDGGPVN